MDIKVLLAIGRNSSRHYPPPPLKNSANDTAYNPLSISTRTHTVNLTTPQNVSCMHACFSRIGIVLFPPFASRAFWIAFVILALG
jgi:hypothetical protein